MHNQGNSEVPAGPNACFSTVGGNHTGRACKIHTFKAEGRNWSHNPCTVRPSCYMLSCCMTIKVLKIQPTSPTQGYRAYFGSYGHNRTPAHCRPLAPMDILTSPVPLSMFFNFGEKSENLEETPRRHRVNMQTPHTKT